MLVQEEGRLKMMIEQSVYLVVHDGAASNRKRNSGKKHKALMKIIEGQVRKETKCFFCKKFEHFKKNFVQQKAWFEKKGIRYVYVYFESSLIEVSNNT